MAINVVKDAEKEYGTDCIPGRRTPRRAAWDAEESGSADFPFSSLARCGGAARPAAAMRGLLLVENELDFVRSHQRFDRALDSKCLAVVRQFPAVPANHASLIAIWRIDLASRLQFQNFSVVLPICFHSKASAGRRSSVFAPFHLDSGLLSIKRIGNLMRRHSQRHPHHHFFRHSSTHSSAERAAAARSAAGKATATAARKAATTTGKAAAATASTP